MYHTLPSASIWSLQRPEQWHPHLFGALVPRLTFEVRRGTCLGLFRTSASWAKAKCKKSKVFLIWKRRQNWLARTSAWWAQAGWAQAGSRPQGSPSPRWSPPSPRTSPCWPPGGDRENDCSWSVSVFLCLMRTHLCCVRDHGDVDVRISPDLLLWDDDLGKKEIVQMFTLGRQIERGQQSKLKRSLLRRWLFMRSCQGPVLRGRPWCWGWGGPSSRCTSPPAQSSSPCRWKVKKF